MDRSDLVKKVAKRTGHSKKDVNDIVVAFTEEIQEALIFGMDVKIKEFANFDLKISPERNKVNPRTGEAFVSPKRYRVKVTLSKVFDEKLRQKTVY